MRSGKLLATNDQLVLKVINSPLYDIRPDGTIWTRFAPTGKVYLDETKWREAGSFKDKTNHRYWIIGVDGVKIKRSRIIYAKFLAGKDGNPQLEMDLVINHKDGNSLNDHPSNLELVPQGRNNEHRFRELGRAPVIGHKRLSYEVAEQIRADKRIGLTHRQLMDKYSITSKGLISEIVNYKIWTAEIHSK